MKSENSAQIPPMKTVFLKGHGKFSSAWPKAELLLGKAEDVARGVDPVAIEIVKLQAWALNCTVASAPKRSAMQGYTPPGVGSRSLI